MRAQLANFNKKNGSGSFVAVVLSLLTIVLLTDVRIDYIEDR